MTNCVMPPGCQGDVRGTVLLMSGGRFSLLSRGRFSLVAEAINDVPEFLLDQIGKMRNCYDVPTIARAMDYIADAVNRIADE